jgi:hypothetical protein
MAIEAVPFVIYDHEKHEFGSIEEAAQKLNEILATGSYVTHIALEAQPKDAPFFNEKGFLILVDKPEGKAGTEPGNLQTYL